MAEVEAVSFSRTRVTTRPPVPSPPHRPHENPEAIQRRVRRQNAAAVAASLVLLLISTTLLPFAARATRAGVLVHVLAAAWSLGLLGLVFVLCRRHVRLRRLAGYENACFDCLDLRAPANPWNPESLSHLR